MRQVPGCPLFALEFLFGDQINGNGVRDQFDIAMCLTLLKQGHLDGTPSCIGGVIDPTVAVTALFGEVITPLAIFATAAAKGDTVVDQFADGRLALFGNKLGHIAVAQSNTSIQGIFNMCRNGVGGRCNSCDTALGIEGATVGYFTLGKYGHFGLICQRECQGQPCCAAANDEDVGLKLLHIEDNR